MIKYSQIENIFASYDIEVHEYNVETNEDIYTPYVVYTATGGNTFGADSINYFNTLDVGLALIDETLDFAMQRRIEKVFDDNSVTYDKQINFDNDQRVYSIAYNFEVIDDEFD